MGQLSDQWYHEVNKVDEMSENKVDEMSEHNNGNKEA